MSNWYVKSHRYHFDVQMKQHQNALGLLIKCIIKQKRNCENPAWTGIDVQFSRIVAHQMENRKMLIGPLSIAKEASSKLSAKTFQYSGKFDKGYYLI